MPDQSGGFLAFDENFQESFIIEPVICDRTASIAQSPCFIENHWCFVANLAAFAGLFPLCEWVIRAGRGP
ncbi:hypothetical protein ACFQFQ_05385 [Sulfitobacter porphyrae]|uniref:Uncharacterized protein n=1 Tax=Sulfitobacter porphyrae TaxID=1246864 RepID=A0ABW2B1E4_9RHOB